MQRYFIPETGWRSADVLITENDAHHITRVMRQKIGDKIICNHIDGRAAICEITSMEDQTVLVAIIEWLNNTSELPVEVTIAQGLPKGDKLELVLQKGTELGASKFIPFQAERSVVQWDGKKTDKKLDRFRKIVKEASEQSHRTKVPEIMDPMSIKGLLEVSAAYDVCIFAYEEAAKTSHEPVLSKVIQNLKRNDRVLVCIGPEGGFTENEVAILKEGGFLAVRLGPRILRTETAAIYVLSSISYQLEELDCI